MIRVLKVSEFKWSQSQFSNDKVGASEQNITPKIITLYDLSACQIV